MTLQNHTALDSDEIQWFYTNFAWDQEPMKLENLPNQEIWVNVFEIKIGKEFCLFCLSIHYLCLPDFTWENK